MKKFLIPLLVLLIVVLFAGCTYTPPIILGGDESGGSGSGGTGSGSGTVNPLPGNDTDDETGITFTVSLVIAGSNNRLIPFSPRSDMHINAVWTGEGAVYTAEFGVNGIATMSGLDGKYVVSLTSLPDNYTYDPNGNYDVNNYRNSIEIELKQITPTNGSGWVLDANDNLKGRYDDAIVLSGPGYFRATLKSESDRVFYQFSPSNSGKYSVESWVDCKADEINPKMNYYAGHPEYINVISKKEYDFGGKVGQYTKNFKFECQKNEDFMGTWWFSIYATAKRKFPVTVDFSITYLGEASGNAEIVNPRGRFDERMTVSSWTGTAEQDITVSAGGSKWRYIYQGEPGNLLDGNKVRLNWTDTNANGVYDDGDLGDGYYHVMTTDAEGNAVMGPTLYVRLTINSQYITTSDVAPAGFASHETHDGHTGPTGNLTLFLGNRSYYDFIDRYRTYSVTKGGVHPVNPELRQFLEDYAKFSDSKPLFDDGHGAAEDAGLTSGPDGIWMFCCGYYSDSLIVRNA